VLEGFKIGADDYITKPFSMEELIFRIEAILRRTSQEGKAPIRRFISWDDILRSEDADPDQ